MDVINGTEIRFEREGEQGLNSTTALNVLDIRLMAMQARVVKKVLT